MAAHVLDIELDDQIADQAVGGHAEAFVLLRLAGRPVGSVRVRCAAGIVQGRDIQAAITADAALSKRLAQMKVHDWLQQQAQPRPPVELNWSIVICTRDRTDDLRRCLESLRQIATPHGEIIVVDNAPSDDATARLVAQYPVRYVREDRIGLNWARSRGADTATGDILIFTDDDVVVDRRWVDAMLEPFAHPRVAAVTGLTLPLELETAAQELFEQYGGFGRGFQRRAFDYTTIPPAAAGMVGAGANMALRRDIVTSMRLFDAELDCGTVTRTGGDAYAFYQLLAAGYQIVYTPDALTWHRHRRDYAALRRTLAGYSVGGFAFLTRCWHLHGDWQALAVAASWFRHDHVVQLARVLLRRPRALPFDLVWAQIVACPLGPWTYLLSRRHERAKLQPAAIVETGGASYEQSRV